MRGEVRWRALASTSAGDPARGTTATKRALGRGLRHDAARFCGELASHGPRPMASAGGYVSLEQEEREALKKAAAIIARRGEEAADYLEKAKASSPRR